MLVRPLFQNLLCNEPWMRKITHSFLHLRIHITIVGDFAAYILFLNHIFQKICHSEADIFVSCQGSVEVELFMIQHHKLIICVVVVGLVIGPYGVSESWGGDVTTSDRDRSVPRLCCYLYNYYRLLPPHRFQQFLDLSFFSGTDSHWSPVFHSSTPLCSLIAPASLLPTCPGAGQPFTWTAPPPAGFHLSYMLPSLAGRPQWVPCARLCMLSLFQLPQLHHPLPAPRSLSALGVIPSHHLWFRWHCWKIV